MSYCATPTSNRRRTFWTTQLCNTTPGDCGQDCGVPALQLTSSNCGRYHCQCCPPPTVDPDCIAAQRPPISTVPRSIVTTDWLRSLVLNILYTDGKLENTACGYQPGTQGGHWSESFSSNGVKIGSLIRTIPAQASIRDCIALIRARVIADLNVLVKLGVAISVSVEATYLGGNRMRADITVTGPAGDTARVGLTGARLANSWAWN